MLSIWIVPGKAANPGTKVLDRLINNTLMQSTTLEIKSNPLSEQKSLQIELNYYSGEPSFRSINRENTWTTEGKVEFNWQTYVSKPMCINRDCGGISIELILNCKIELNHKKPSLTHFNWILSVWQAVTQELSRTFTCSQHHSYLLPLLEISVCAALYRFTCRFNLISDCYQWIYLQTLALNCLTIW